MQKVSDYRDKLQSMSSIMKSLDVRSRQLKDRVSQLHKARINYDVQAVNARKKNQEHDKAVAASPTTQSVSVQSSPMQPSSRSSSPFKDASDQTVALTPRIEDSSLSVSIGTETTTPIKKKKKAKAKKREAVIDEGPMNLKRTIPPKLPGRSPK
jgi:hypothetical protein